MTRMESIRRQYEGTAAPPPQGGGGRAYPARPRNVFWRWFWLVFLLTLLGGFFAAKGTLAGWLDRMRGNETKGSVEFHAATPSVEGQPAGKAAHAVEKVDATSVKGYVNPSLAEMNQLCEYVRNSPNVRENLQYADIMKSVVFVYDDDSDAVNAYASVKQLDASTNLLTRVIVYQAGAARFGRVAALAAAAEMCGDKGASKRFVASLTRQDLRGFTDEVAARVMANSGLVASLGNQATMAKARSVSAGMMLSVVAHEAGHQALGHVLDTSNSSMEVSRNQEREADSFASSVIASSPFSEYMLIGTLFWHYALAQQVDTVATSHPLSKERFENFVRANAELAASMGIVVK